MSQVAITAVSECVFEFLHHGYPPCMAPSVFYLFPKLKSHLPGTQYGSYEGDIRVVNEYLGDQEKAFYFERIRKLRDGLVHCIDGSL